MSKKLYIGNLSYEVNLPDLEALFTQAGTVESANITTDKFSGQSRGFGFVEMASNADAQSAIKRFDGYNLKGRSLTVNEAQPQEGQSRSSWRFFNKRW